MLPLRKLALSSTPRSSFAQFRYASSCSSTSLPTLPHSKNAYQLDNVTLWTPLDGLPVNEFANLAFFSMDRPLLDLYNQDHSQWEHSNNWTPSAYQPYHPPPTPDTHQTSTISTSDSPESTGSTTTTITLDISRVDGQLQVVSSEVLGQEQVADYLVAMQQRWEQQQRKRSLARKRYLLRKKGFFEKN